VRVRSLLFAAILISITASAFAQSAAKAAGAPETFMAKARAENSSGGAIEGPLQVHLDRYTPDFDRTAVENGLKYNGFPGFVAALRKAPEVGYVELNGQKTAIRWARQTPSAAGRTIVVVTDKPVFFLGAGGADAKPRAGYDVALLQLLVDAGGSGTGTMAAAARVKPGGPTGVQIDDYADVPVKLLSITRQ
jgi:hypothetical protein